MAMRLARPLLALVVVSAVMGFAAECAHAAGVVWLGVDLAPSSHAAFEVPMAPASPSYRVRIFAFDTSRRK